MTQQPMRDRGNVLGQCLGDEVKNLAKTSWKERVVSMVLFVSGVNAKKCLDKEASGWIRVPCVKWRMSYL